MKKKQAVSTLAAICLVLTTGCSRAGEATAPDAQGSMANAVAQEAAAVERSGASMPADEAGSRVLGKKDITLRGAPACEIDFVYAGMEAEDLFWEEPSAAVTAKMMTQQTLEALGKWDRLDSFAMDFVNALPGGRVLYVEGSVSASVYPVGTTGASYEVAVAD